MPVDQKISAFISNALHLLAGIMIGTAVSFPLNGIPFSDSYLLALVLSPFTLTLLLSFEFRFGSTWIGIAAVIGLCGVILCSILALSEKNGWRWRLGTLCCGILWSLGSAFAMEVMMSI
jgi:hypothetical protein